MKPLPFASSCRLFSKLGLVIFFSFTAVIRGPAVVTPAFDRAFCNHPVTGDSIRSQMTAEAGNPLINGIVVNLINNAPVDVNGDNVPDFASWSGTLISAEWVLTCAHALEGNDGAGGGIPPANLQCRTDDGQVLDVAAFHINPAWQKDQYLLGNDIALVRLAEPAVGVATFARLSASPFGAPFGVVFAGYGDQGNGDAGGNGAPGALAAGVNVLDVVGGAQAADGAGHAYTPFPNAPASIAFMDFDKWESVPFTCQDPINGAVMSEVPVALSAFSTMGVENEITSPPVACAGPLQPAAGHFASPVCDFLPADGDSGGPVFLWPGYPNIPQAGYYLTGIPVVHAVVSFRNEGAAATLNAVYGNVAGCTLVQSHLAWIYQTAREIAELDSDLDGATDEAEFLAGSDPYVVPHAPATYVPRPLDILIRNLRILGEWVVGANETEIEFTGDLLNEDSGRYFDLSLNVVRSLLPASAVVTDAQLNYPTLSESGTAVPGSTDTLSIRVANADLDAVRQLILSGQLTTVSAFEEQVYAGPTRYIDAPTDDAFDTITFNLLNELVLVFTNQTELLMNLQPGDFLVADGATGGYRPEQPSPTDQWALPYLSQQIPFEVSSVSLVDGKVHVAGHKRQLTDILKSGTFLADDANFNGSTRDLLDPPVENTYTEEEKEARSLQALVTKAIDPTSSALADLLGMNVIPWRFNEVEITEHLQLSGQVLLRSSGLRIQLSIRDFTLKRASVGIDTSLTASVLLETTGTNNNTSVPVVDKQKELARLPLPGIPFTIGGVPCEIGPTFVLTVGAEANAPGGVSIPFETSVTLGTEIGWADGQTFSTPIKEFVAPHVSDPTVFEAVGISAKAWAEARLEVTLSVAGGLANAGPSLAVRAEASFDAAPFSDPWWNFDVGADLVAAFQMDVLGLNVARVETTEPIADFFHRDSGGPFVEAPAFAPAAAGSTPVDLGPKSGKEVRWGLAYAMPTASASYSKGFVTPLTGGGCFIGGSAAIQSFLGGVSAEGDLLWMQTFPTGGKPVDAVQLADGSVVVAGYQGHDWWLASYDATGNRQWVRSFRMQADLRDLEVGTSDIGDPEFYLAGFQSVVIVTQSDPVLLKLDKGGNLLWSRVYTLPTDDEVYSIRALRDGHLLLAGETGSKVGTDLFIGARANGLLMKITTSGDIVWATAVPARWGMAFNDTAEGPDGSIYAVGSHGDIVWNYYPSILVGKFTADGELVHHVLLGEDPDMADVLPDGGDTPYDFAAQVVWTGDSLVLVGNTGLGGTLSGWVASMTDELGVRWFTVFDGPKASAFGDVAITDKGIMAMGWAENAWPDRFGVWTPGCLLSLPWEGIMRFHPLTGIQSHYVQPRGFLSSEHPDFIGRATDAFGRNVSVPTAPVPFVISETVPPVGGNVAAGVAATTVTARLERLDFGLVDNFEEWVAYNQLTGTDGLATGDPDEDGVKNQWEFFTGTNPTSAETDAPLGLSILYAPDAGMVEISFLRARAAAGEGFNLQYSVDLVSWQSAAGVAERAEAFDDLLDLVTLTLPQPDPNHAFFRLELLGQ